MILIYLISEPILYHKLINFDYFEFIYRDVLFSHLGALKKIFLPIKLIPVPDEIRDYIRHHWKKVQLDF